MTAGVRTGRAQNERMLFRFAYFSAHARTTLAEAPCRWGRNVARFSSSKMKVPPGPMANALRIRSLASHATVQVWRHSPSTKRMTVPLGGLQGQEAQLGQAVLEMRPLSFRRQREPMPRRWRTSGGHDGQCKGRASKYSCVQLGRRLGDQVADQINITKIVTRRSKWRVAL